MPTTTYSDVATAAALSADIKAIDLASQSSSATTGTNYVITLKAGATLTEAAELFAINLKGNDTLAITGQGAILDGAKAHRGLFVYSGTVRIEDLTIRNTLAKGGAGGAGGGGGGGAGLGGGLFVANDAANGAAPGKVTLDNVTFASNAAVGGAGGGGTGETGQGGGGLGGNGGLGGGGIGAGAVGGAVGRAAGAGIVPGAAGASGSAGAGGASGGGGGYSQYGGYGGGIGGTSYEGGFGGGGGGSISQHTGGFGGGGGGNSQSDGGQGGRGGYGGGGGGGYSPYNGGYVPYGGSGGFGGGKGAGDGGGGLGAGGDVFVMDGASLTIEDGTLSGGTAMGGAGAANGQAYGGGIFLQGNENIIFAPTIGNTEVITDVIADEEGSDPPQYGNPLGIGSLTLNGPGTLILNGANMFTGGVTIDAGTLKLGNVAGAGTGTITFAADAAATLVIAGGINPANTIADFTARDDIDLTGLAYKTSYEAAWGVTATGGKLKIIDTAANNAVVAAYNFVGSYGGEAFVPTADGSGGTAIGLVAAPWATPVLGDVLYTSVPGQAYQAFVVHRVDGLLSGTDYYYTNIMGKPYDAYALDHSAGGDLIGSKYFYPGPQGAAYSRSETDLDGSGRVTRLLYTGAAGGPYALLERDYTGGVFAGSTFTYTHGPAGTTGSSYQQTYNYAGTYTGEKVFYDIKNRIYNKEEDDSGASGKIQRVIYSGYYSGYSASAIENDFSAGVYTGEKIYATNITGRAYTSSEVDYDQNGKITRRVLGGITNAAYSSTEKIIASGTITYNYTNVSGKSYYGYHLQKNASGMTLKETDDLNNGGHQITGHVDGLSLASIGNDIITGGGSRETFVLNPIFGHDEITDFSAHLTGATHDTISLTKAEFTDFATLLAHTTYTGDNAVIKAATTGDTLTLDHMTKAMLTASQGDFVFR